jgi:alpha-D-ribose 1-methylphosphonate 5-triphosphate diphosphatase
VTGILIEGGRALQRRDRNRRRGLLVLPGIVDLHGYAFERQTMPRSGVDFPIDVALFDSDRLTEANRHVQRS